MTSLTTRVVDAMYSRWNAKDLDGILRDTTVDVIWSTPGGTDRSPDAFGLTETTDKLKAVAAAWDGWEVRVHRMIRLDDTVLVSGVHVRAAGGEVPFRHLWDLRDERVCRLREQLDSTALLHVLAGAA